MKISDIIAESKSYFGKDRTRLKEKILSFQFDGKEDKEWKKSLESLTNQPFDIRYGMFADLIENIEGNKLDDIDWDYIGDISWEFKILLRACLNFFKLIINSLWFWRDIKEGVYRDK